jgi:hypothetical protein
VPSASSRRTWRVKPHGFTWALAKRLGMLRPRSNGRTSRNWLVRCSRCQPVEIPVAMTASTAASPMTQIMQIDARAIVRLLCVAYSSESTHRIS